MKTKVSLIMAGVFIVSALGTRYVTIALWDWRVRGFNHGQNMYR